MAARIVYEGVRAGDGGGGTLFEGIKFHLLRRTPMIDHIQGLVESNGGEITKLERGADIVITDHLRAAQAPPDSISYKYILESVKNGELEDLEDHRVGQPAKTQSTTKPRQAAPQSGKTTKTAFTKSDDQILMEWCSKAERKGAAMGGNQIYKMLESKYPHHTFHSWRDRWIKHVQFRARPSTANQNSEDEQSEGDEEEDEEADEPSPAKPKPKKLIKISKGKELTSGANNPRMISQASRDSVRSLHAAKQRVPIPKSRILPQQRAPAPVTSAPHEEMSSPRAASSLVIANEFTEEDIQELYAAYDDILNIDEDKVIDAWIAWAEVYPAHTAQEWRNYFNKNINGRPNPQKPQTRKHQFGASQSSPERSVSQQGPKPFHRGSSSPPSTRPHRNKDQGNDSAVTKSSDLIPVPEIKDSQGSSNRTISSVEAPKAVESTSAAEENFNSNIQLFASQIFPDYNVDLTPIICGKRISLYKLWQTVLSEAFIGTNEVDDESRWPEVANALGYEKLDVVQAGAELRACYNELLAHLSQYMEDSDEFSPSQADEMVADQLLQTANEAALRDEVGEDYHAEQDGEFDDDLGAPQYSPFVTSPAKRPSTADSTPSKNKRRRVGKNNERVTEVLEIPSTPDEVTRSFHRINSPEPSPLGNHHYNVDLTSARKVVEQRSSLSPSPAKSKSIPLRSNSNSQNRASLGSKRSTPRRYSGGSAAGSSTQSHNPSTQSQLLEFTTRCERLGYSHEIIETALHSTTLLLGGISTHVMESLFAGKGVPQDAKGVWTTEDDEDLEMWALEKNSKGKGLEKDKGKGMVAYRRLVAKHGRDGVKERRIFLKNLKD